MRTVKQYRDDFPVLSEHPNLVYLDSAATSLKPKSVIEAMNVYYQKVGANVHRGVYQLSYEATRLYDEAREEIASFIHCPPEQLIFTRGCSAALNLFATSYGLDFLEEGDEVITSELEHHSSMLPWQHMCKRKKAKLVYVPLTPEGRITVEAVRTVITSKTKVVALTHVSNVMGYITPVKEIVALAHQVGAIVVIDGAQAIPHLKVDVTDLDCDIYAFSGHKMLGPTGIGCLYGKKELLEAINPLEFGGDMADIVTCHSATYKVIPYKFEAGTPMIAEVIGLGEACRYLKQIGVDNIHAHEYRLKELALQELRLFPEVLIHNASCETGIISFNIAGVHPHDAASVFDKNEVCIRAGHHCAQPCTAFLKQGSTLRASFYLYNHEEDVRRFIESVKETIQFFGQF